MMRLLKYKTEGLNKRNRIVGKNIVRKQVVSHLINYGTEN